MMLSTLWPGFGPRRAGVRPAAGTSVEDIAARLPAGLTVLTGDDRGGAEFGGITASVLPLILLSSIFGGMVMVVMALVVWATISLSVRQRQPELALLRATGATPTQVRGLVVTETMAVAALATAGGLVLGRLTGDWIFGQSVARGVVPPALEFRQGPIPFAAGALLALLAPWLVARFAAGAAGRTKPIQALVEAALSMAQLGARAVGQHVGGGGPTWRDVPPRQAPTLIISAAHSSF